MNRQIVFIGATSVPALASAARALLRASVAGNQPPPNIKLLTAKPYKHNPHKHKKNNKKHANNNNKNTAQHNQTRGETP